MGKRYLIQRLSWYYPTERFNAGMFGAVALYVAFVYPFRQSMFLLYGLAVMVYILFQGQKYWQLKLYRLTGKIFDQTASLAFFRKAKGINFVLIILMPVVWLLQLGLSGWTLGSIWILFWAFAANGFAILEHINYYYRQLSIDNTPDWNYLRRHKRFKVAQLARDLAAGRI